MKTVLPVEAMCESLKKIGYKCEVSNSAGKFLCNFIYYASLLEGQVRGIPSLFVHVPPFEVFNFE